MKKFCSECHLKDILIKITQREIEPHMVYSRKLGLNTSCVTVEHCDEVLILIWKEMKKCNKERRKRGGNGRGWEEQKEGRREEKKEEDDIIKFFVW